MSETDKLNLFKGGLKPWVRAEIQWSRVLDLDSAISQAMSLVTQQSVLRDNSKPSILSRGGIGNKSMSLSRENGGGDSHTSMSRAQVVWKGRVLTTHFVPNETGGA